MNRPKWVEKAVASLEARSNQLRRRHHVVPRFYLERFANEGEIGIWDTSDRELRTSSPTNTSVINNFYMVYDEDGTPYDFFEVELLEREVESPAAPAISRALESGVISEEDRKAIARFTGFQYVRGQRFPEPIEESLLAIARTMMAQTADLLESGYEVAGVADSIREVKGREPTKEDYEEFTEALRSGEAYKIEINRPANVATYLGLGEKAGSVLTSRDWQLVTFEQPVLITADEPVWLQANGADGPYGEGLGTAPAVWISLSPKVALRMTRVGDADSEPSSVDPEWLNQGVKEQAHRFLFGDPDLLEAVAG